MSKLQCLSFSKVVWQKSQLAIRAGVIGTTLENLRAAAAGEHEEWSLDYPHFADVAEQEGFPMIAAMYRNISIAEKGHEERYLAFVNNIENMTVFAKEGEVVMAVP